MSSSHRSWRRPVRPLTVLVVTAAALVGCGASGDASPSSAPSAAEALADGGSAQQGAQRFPDVLAVELVPRGEGTFDVRVTLSSPYDTPQRYADGWRVLGPDGTVLGAHTLLHDHADEQPFTRTQPGLVVPADVDAVTVEGRDLTYGYGGRTVVVAVP
jgi:hypothetical protein